MDTLGRYYTQGLFSTLLVNQIKMTNPKIIVDLGVGSGSLVKAAIHRWGNTKFYAVDIDKNSVKQLRKEFPFVNSFHMDTLKEDVSEKLQIRPETVDIAICNPPFLKIKNSSYYSDLFEKTNLNECKKLRILTSEIIFLANNIQLLRPSGELGIILPDSLITGKDFRFFREAILQQYDLKGVIELPENIYPKTEALTHIIIIKKIKGKHDKTPLFLADKTGRIVEEIDILKSSLVERMDFKYHSWKIKSKKEPSRTLATIRAEVKRGTLTHKELVATNDTFIHTSQIKKINGNQCIKSFKKSNSKYLLAERGDILLARVGRNCFMKICKISRGKAPLTDCVYRIRVSKKYQNKVWSALSSTKGQKWLQAVSHGVCAKVISKRDLLNFPLE